MRNGVSRLPAQSDMSSYDPLCSSPALHVLLAKQNPARKQAKMQTISPKSQTCPFSQIISLVNFFFSSNMTTHSRCPTECLAIYIYNLLEVFIEYKLLFLTIVVIPMVDLYYKQTSILGIFWYIEGISPILGMKSASNYKVEFLEPCLKTESRGGRIIY